MDGWWIFDISEADGLPKIEALQEDPNEEVCARTGPPDRDGPAKLCGSCRMMWESLRIFASSLLFLLFSPLSRCDDCVSDWKPWKSWTLHRYQKAMKILEKYFPLEVRSCDGSCQGFWTRISSFRYWWNTWEDDDADIGEDASNLNMCTRVYWKRCATLRNFRSTGVPRQGFCSKLSIWGSGAHRRGRQGISERHLTWGDFVSFSRQLSGGFSFGSWGWSCGTTISTSHSTVKQSNSPTPIHTSISSICLHAISMALDFVYQCEYLYRWECSRIQKSWKRQQHVLHQHDRHKKYEHV